MRSRAKDLSGKKFGRLTVLSRAPRGERKNRRAVWNCECECGNASVSGSDALLSGHAKSCGCLSSDTAKKVHTKHGGASGGAVSAEYQAWINMRARCSGAQAKCWKNYGGRGIRVCDDWARSFQAFFDHVGPRPDGGYELDRIDNDGDYEPGNVRWVTKSENNRNRRSKSQVWEDDHVS